MEDVDEQGDKLGHLLKLWADSYSLIGEVKGGTIPLNYNKFIVTSNYTIDEIFGYDPQNLNLTDRSKKMKDELVKAIKGRFKIIQLNSRAD